MDIIELMRWEKSSFLDIFFLKAFAVILLFALNMVQRLEQESRVKACIRKKLSYLMFYTSALEFPVVVITIMPKCSLSNLDVLCGGLNAVRLNHPFFSQ